MHRTLLLLALLACDDKDDTGAPGDTADTSDTSDTSAPAGAVIDPSFFADSPALISSELVECELEDGTIADCYALVFSANPVEGGPYCPETVEDVGGLGVYDGPTNPGLRVLDAALWADMAADGYDVVDADGNVTISSPPAGGGPPPTPAAEGPEPSCLQVTPDDSLTLRFLIPAEPTLLDSPSTIGEVDLIGLSLEGAPINGEPPSVVEHNGAIPAIDPCGGHVDPAGYYHWHLAAASANSMLAREGIDAVRCTQIEQDDAALVGFARDGFPMYGSADADGSAPTDLDACGGHTGPTGDFPDGVYHYHASSTEALNLQGCVVGKAALDQFGVE